ncbi:MAG: PfaB family protein [Chloroflexaceae bacterium]|nr:PfaB family protein [Chloroflexaceae bacterium]
MPLTEAEQHELTTLARDSLFLWAQVNQYTSFIGNVIASRVSALWDFTGPALTVSDDNLSTLRALDLARILLRDSTLDAVVIGAVDLAGGIESVHAHLQHGPLASGAATLSHDAQAAGWQVGEGAGAIVVQRYEQAQQTDRHIYAVIEGMGFARDDGKPSSKAVVQASQHALHEAGVPPAEVGYLELWGSGIASEDAAEAAGLQQVYRRAADAPLSCAVGSIKAQVGHTFTAASMAGLLRAILCLDERYIPPTPGWHAPQDLATWQASSFYVAPEPRPWLLPHDIRRRVAAVNVIGSDGTHAHLVLAEAEQQPPRSSAYLHEMTLHLFPLTGTNEAALLAHLDTLEQEVRAGTTLAHLAYRRFEAWQHHTSAPYTLALVADSAEALLREIERARAGVPAAFAGEQQGEWKTPAGSYFTAQPQGRTGKVAFVYPGAFNAYVGLGQHLFRLFPLLHEQFARITRDAAGTVNDRLLYPRSQTHLAAEEVRDHEAQMLGQSINMLEVGSSFSVLYTIVLREVFGIQPAIAFGYSQGETAMVQALGVWTDGDACSRALRESPLYHTRLAGPKQAVREFWGTAPDTPADDELWANYILMTSADKVRPHLEDEPHVYLAIITAPREVMIAGDPAACQRVIKKVGCRSLRTPFGQVIHSPPIVSEYEEFVRINRFPVTPVPDIQFYSAAEYAPLTLDTDTVAQSIAKVFCNQLDFTRLVEQVYAAGARIFVEVGAARTCSRWVDSILDERPHVALSVNKRGVDDHTSLVRLLAQLASHSVPLNLAPLYAPPASEPPRHALLRQVPTGGACIADIFGTPDQQLRFHPQAVPPEPAAPVVQSNGHRYAAVPAYEPQPLISLESQDTPMSITPEHAPVTASAPHVPEQATVSAIATLYTTYQDTLRHSTILESRAHAAFLGSRRESLRQLFSMVQQQMQLGNGNGANSNGYHPPKDNGHPSGVVPHEAPAPVGTELPFTPRYSTPSNVVWNEADLLEFAQGSIAKVFGDQYAIIDNYSRRVRLPAPPYLLVSRVTRIAGTLGEFKPCSITTEYDIPKDAWYSVDRQAPWAISVESGQCDLLLISYLGIDFAAQGNRVYRLLDCTLTFMDDLPKEGETLRYDIDINSFVRSGDGLLFFFSYNCYIGDKMVLKMTDGCAGFFTDDELAHGRGIILSDKEHEARRHVVPRHFDAPLTTPRTSFGYDDLLRLSVGDIAGCFGPNYQQHGRNRSLRLPPRQMLMIDRVVSVDPNGGTWGLGVVEAEKDLSAEHWYFPCHFPDDQVLAGSLMAEACGQLLQFFMLYVGLQTRTTDARFQPIPNEPQAVRCRGQVTPNDTMLTYRLEVTDVGLEPYPYAFGNVDVLLGDRVVVNFNNLGLHLKEKTNEAL